MIRTTIMVGVIAGLMMAAPAPTDAQAYCRCECYRVPGGRVCRRVCSYPQPRYVEPAYAAPHYVVPQRSYVPPVSGPSFPPELAALLLLLGAGALIAFLTQAISTASVRAASKATEQETLAARTLTDQADTAAQEIDAFVENSARAHFERGRAAADDEWTRG